MPGPLHGIRIVELAGIGPGPFCGMMLADHGAEVIRVDRLAPGGNPNGPVARSNRDPLLRSRINMVLDLKSPDDIARLRDLLKTADGMIEGFRPGVIERLGIGPDVLLADNPNLVIGRMTGWGQTGPYAAAAGHDINYIALSGVLGALGRAGEKPTPPINLVGDFGGGAMMLAFGMVSALLGVKNGAPGQVIDCAMTDGSALLMSMMWGFRATGMWGDTRGTNMLDTGAAYYDTYETSDGKFVSIGSIEPQFYALLRDKLGITDEALFDAQHDRSQWPAQKERLTAIFKSKTRDEWCDLMEATDVCFAPVLAWAEVVEHPHNRARGTFIEVNGVIQPAPAPRYSATPCDPPL